MAKIYSMTLIDQEDDTKTALLNFTSEKKMYEYAFWYMVNTYATRLQPIIQSIELKKED